MSTEAEAWRRADEVFEELLDVPSEKRSEALVGRGLAPQVVDLVRRLLAEDDRLGPLDQPLGWEATPVAEVPALTGRRMGVYRLVEEIGRGGMGVVYRARRDAGDFEQEVAIKALPLGLIPTAATRFRREQQVLARLQHPGIATILDGGVAEDGTPYLVMELIQGRRIDQHCEERQLGARERVELIAMVCDAVAFAHRNLVVHRDLKPGNVLVAAEGPKLLDFGIAKLLDPETGDLTRQEDRLLTPAYAAPEQLAGEGITTATDVFALGVILDELVFGGAVSGRNPERRRPRLLALDDDLGLIVGMAVREEPERRYRDARALADDLRAWLANRPVVARGDHPWYRVSKWLRRHRGFAAASALVALVLALGVASTQIQARRAEREARGAAAVSAFLIGLFEAGDPSAVGGEDPPASVLLLRGAERARSELGNQPLIQAELLNTIGRVLRDIGRHREAEEALREALRLRERFAGVDDPAAIETRAELALVQHERGHLDHAIEQLEQAVADFDGHAPAADPRALRSRIALADLWIENGAAERASVALVELLAELDGAHPELEVAARWSLGSAKGMLGDWDAALAELGDAVAREKALHPAGSARLVGFLNDLGITAYDAQRLDQSHDAFVEALELARRLHGPTHPVVARTLSNLGLAHEARGELDLALRRLRESVALTTAAYGPDHPETASAHASLANAAWTAGDLEAALTEFETATTVFRQRGVENNALAAGAFMTQHGSLLIRLGRSREALGVLLDALRRLEVELEPTHYRVALAESLIGLAELETGYPQAAWGRVHRVVGTLVETWGEADGKTVLARVTLARAATALGDTERAAAEAKAALESGWNGPDPYLAEALEGLRETPNP